MGRLFGGDHAIGAGERLWDNLDGGPHGYRCTQLAASDAALHLVFERD